MTDFREGGRSEEKEVRGERGGGGGVRRWAFRWDLMDWRRGDSVDSVVFEVDDFFPIRRLFFFAGSAEGGEGGEEEATVVPAAEANMSSQEDMVGKGRGRLGETGGGWEVSFRRS